MVSGSIVFLYKPGLFKIDHINPKSRDKSPDSVIVLSGKYLFIFLHPK